VKVKSLSPNPAIIDFEECLRLTNNDNITAKQLLQLLDETILEYVNAIKIAYHQGDYVTIQSITHKLHGGFMYCSTPQLKSCVLAIREVNTPGNRNKLDTCIQAFAKAANQFKQEYQIL
jgi:HPt (histidine-containing phosphotransfer) domain-containing protein